jgi:hypothetical protein
MKLLATVGAATATLYGVLYLVPAPIPPDTAWYDKAILYIIAVVFSTAAVVMLISRRTWTLRAIGLLLSAMAIATLSWNAVYLRQKGYSVKDGRVVSNVSPGVSEALGDLWRTLFLVGGPLLMIGLMFYVWGRFGPDHSTDPFLGERRKAHRREEDKQVREQNASLIAKITELERSTQ